MTRSRSCSYNSGSNFEHKFVKGHKKHKSVDCIQCNYSSDSHDSYSSSDYQMSSPSSSRYQISSGYFEDSVYSSSSSSSSSKSRSKDSNGVPVTSSSLSTAASGEISMGELQEQLNADINNGGNNGNGNDNRECNRSQYDLMLISLIYAYAPVAILMVIFLLWLGYYEIIEPFWAIMGMILVVLIFGIFFGIYAAVMYNICRR